MTDSLTGAYLRGPGYAELRREIERALRNGAPLTVAFADVNGLKAIGATRGRKDGDAALVAVAQALNAVIRPYDLLIRYDGDEFLCVIPGLALVDASARITLAQERLAGAEGRPSISVGFAELRADDSADTLVARADVALYRDRPQKPTAGSPSPPAPVVSHP